MTSITMNEIVNIKPFYMENVQLNCYIPCILTCLERINEKLSNYFLWNFSFNYKYTIKQGFCCKKEVIGIDTQSFKKEAEEFLLLFNINIIRTRIAERFIEKIRCCINGNMPIIVVIDQYYDTNSTLYLKEKNSFHYIIVVGYNDINSTITYYDYWITGGYGKRTLDYSLFQRGVESYLITDFLATNFEYYTFNASGYKSKQKFLYGSGNYKSVISKMIKFYSCESENYRCLKEYISLLDRKIKNNSCSTEYFEDLFNTFGLDIIAFKGMDEFVVRSIENDDLPELYHQYNNISQKYKAIYNTILKAKYSSNKRDFAKVLELFQKIFFLENEFFTLIIEKSMNNEIIRESLD